MSKEVFMISVGIAFALEIIHSIRTNGKQFTLRFFLIGFGFGFIRELFYANVIRSYTFSGFALSIFNVPVFIPIGWVFTFYLGYEFTKKIIPLHDHGDYLKFIFIAALFSDVICIPIETAAFNMGWWDFNPNWGITDDIAHAGLMTGWWASGVMFFYLYFIFDKKLQLKEIKIPVLMAIMQVYEELFTWVFPPNVFISLAVILVFYSAIFLNNREIALMGILFLIIDLLKSISFLSTSNAFIVFTKFVIIFIGIFWQIFHKANRKGNKLLLNSL